MLYMSITSVDVGFWMCLHKMKINVKQRTTFQGIKSMYSVTSLSTLWTFCYKISVQRWGENIFKNDNWERELHETSNDKGVRVVNISKSKNVAVSCHKLYKTLRLFLRGHNQADHILVESDRYILCLIC